MAERRPAIPAYARQRFIVEVYRTALGLGAATALVAALVSRPAGVSVAAGAAVAVVSFWALERTLAVAYGRSSGTIGWRAVGLAVGKYALIGIALLAASRIEAVSMALLALGLAVVYAAVVVAATRDMIRRRAADRAAAGTKDVV